MESIKIRALLRPILLFILFLPIFIPGKTYSQPNYGFDFSRSWEWEDLINETVINTPAFAPMVQELKENLTIEDARIIFYELSQLNSLDEIHNLNDVVRLDRDMVSGIWTEKIDAQLGGFSPDPTFTGMLETAARLTRARLPMEQGTPQFKNKTYLEQPINERKGGVILTLEYYGADEIIDYYGKDEITREDVLSIYNSPPYRTVFENSMSRGITEEDFTDFLELSHNSSTLFNIYKWINPKSFLGFGGVSLYRDRFQTVLSSLKKNETNVNEYVTEKVARYLPDNPGVSSEMYFLFGGGIEGWATDNRKIGINLEYFGDDYEHLLSFMIHEFYYQAEKEVQLPVYEFILNGKDLKFIKLLVEIMAVGTANYIGPIGSENRPSALLEKDFTIFNRAVKFLYSGNNEEVADSLIQYGFHGIGPFYTMGTQMAYIIESTLGRKHLIESIRMGPVYFFNNYIEAYENSPQEIRSVFRFPDYIEERLENLLSDFPRDIMSDALKLKDYTGNATELENGIVKFSQQYGSGPNKDLTDLLIGQLYLEAGEFDKAEEFFMKGMASSKGNTGNTAGVIGRRFFNRGAYSQALHFFDMCAQLEPDDAVCYLNRGESYYKTNQMEMAKTDFQKALELDSNLTLARIYLKMMGEGN